MRVCMRLQEPCHLQAARQPPPPTPGLIRWPGADGSGMENCDQKAASADPCYVTSHPPTRLSGITLIHLSTQ